MHLNLDGLPDQHERMAGFYALRARSGVGLIVTAGCSPDSAGKSSTEGFSLEHDDQISLHQKITRAVHAEGGRIALQILHFGREAFHGGIVSSSAQRLPSNIFTPRPLGEEGILETIEAFAACARRAVEAQYDAIELIFSQGFLVHQFLSPSCNKRSDRWGGSFDNRARIAVEIARAVRNRVGENFPLIYRIPCLDLLEDGLTPDNALKLIEKLMPFGIDLLNVSIGWHESSTPTIAMVVPRAAFASAATYIRKKIPSLKVSVSNRISDPCLAEQLLIDGCADVIAMGRPFLSDYALADKARRNLFSDINTCIACNQSCLDFVFTGKPVGCSVSPDCGLAGEGVYPGFADSKKVAVAGGGIAGLGAALFLARRGAQVTLFEASTRLGGQLQLAAQIPDKQEFKETIRYYVHSLQRAGVDIRLGRSFTESEIGAMSWDYVVLATGSKPRRLDEGIPGIDLPHVISYLDLLENKCPVAFPVVIIGGGGVACDIAKYLHNHAGRYWLAGQRYLEPLAGRYGFQHYLDAAPEVDKRITLLKHSSRKFAHKIGRTTRWILMQELKRAGVTMRKQLNIVRVTPAEVVIFDRLTKQEENIPATTVITASGHQPISGPTAALDRYGIPHVTIGAARAGTRSNTNITSALREAYETALALS